MARSGDKKPFTAELHRRRPQDGEEVDNATLLRAIEALQAQVAALGGGRTDDDENDPQTAASTDPAAPPPVSPTQHAENRLLKIELNALAHSIETTKKEIALLVAEDSQGDRLTTVTNELDAVVSATENATHTILDSVERMAGLAAQIQAQEQDSYIRRLADEIQELTVGVFEACNFQDLTGQRIGKVVNTLKYIEARVDRMMTIWGRDTFRDLPFEPEERSPDVDKRLLNGPQDHVRAISQDEIDLLFG
ncbi:hypothetical protein [Pararhodospirillum photometricum]|uniref:Chemotaxis protein CheZ n=1 Tax=Pararhodospirillum photometricum DSM 122 TaxID=1150469 RepID=H6SQY1_PARPM|nr:hypothetical protein [Pararhodospirillum photometricum]CCG07446.1 Putative uncharacterized protein [Pararhodospirillum photometricum DSM 122]